MDNKNQRILIVDIIRGFSLPVLFLVHVFEYCETKSFILPEFENSHQPNVAEKAGGVSLTRPAIFAVSRVTEV